MNHRVVSRGQARGPAAGRFWRSRGGTPSRPAGNAAGAGWRTGGQALLGTAAGGALGRCWRRMAAVRQRGIAAAVGGAVLASAGLAAVATPAAAKPASWYGVEILTWGSNEFGQLGNSTPYGSDKSEPAPVDPDQKVFPHGTQFQALAGGYGHSLAVDSDGQVWGWGTNVLGVIGNNKADGAVAELPVKVPLPPGLEGVIDVEAGFNISIALGSDKRVYSWGDNNQGKLGQGDSDADSHPLPKRVLLPDTDFKAIATGFGTSLALTESGVLYGWGLNLSMELAPTDAPVETPIKLLPDETYPNAKVKAMDSSETHILALTTDNKIYARGSNSSGALGIGDQGSAGGEGSLFGTWQQVTMPPLPSGVTFTDVTAAGSFSLALASDGTMYAWGENISGQLGNGNTVDQHTPVQVNRPPQNPQHHGATITSIAAGDDDGDNGFSMALTSDGGVLIWGTGDHRLLGDTLKQSNTPVWVDQTNVMGIAAGDKHSMVLINYYIN